MPRRGTGPRLAWRRGCWVIRWTEGGRTRERRVGTDDRRTAETALERFLVERRQRPVGRRGADAYLITDLLADYAEEHGQQVAGKATLGHNMARLLDWWTGKTVTDVTKATCQSYTVHRREMGVTDGTIRRELSVLSAALGHARDAERLRERPKVWMPPPGGRS